MPAPATNLTPTHHIAPSPARVLAPLIAELLGLRSAEAPTVVELCSRTLEQLNELSAHNAHAQYYGIDRTDTSLYPYLDDASPAAGPLRTMYGVEADRLHAIRANVFTFVPQFAHEHADTPVLAYCQPPINGAMNAFSDRADADQMLMHLAGSSPDLQALAAHTPTAPEWYYLYAALCACGERGRAVVRVPSRLLSLARMDADHALLLHARLIEQVILLPRLPFKAGEAPTESVLVVLSHHNDRVRFIDGRHLSPDSSSHLPHGVLEQPFDHSAFSTIIEAVRHPRTESDAPYTPWIMEQTFEQITAPAHPSLMPFFYISRAFEPENYEELGQHFTVQRGTPRKAIASLAVASDAAQGYTPLNHYYLSLKPMISGQILPIEHTAHIVDESDTYDLGSCSLDALQPLKTLSDNDFHVLIARAGTPFKVALLTPCEEEPFDPNDPDACQPVWRDVRAAVLADSALSLTPKPNIGRCRPEFLLAFLSTDEGQALLRTVALGIAIPQLSAGNVRRMRIPVPSYADQERFIERYRAKQAAYEKALAESRRLQEQKRTLM